LSYITAFSCIFMLSQRLLRYWVTLSHLFSCIFMLNEILVLRLRIELQYTMKATGCRIPLFRYLEICAVSIIRGAFFFMPAEGSWAILAREKKNQ
jgi:hypothetical protein